MKLGGTTGAVALVLIAISGRGFFFIDFLRGKKPEGQETNEAKQKLFPKRPVQRFV